MLKQYWYFSRNAQKHSFIQAWSNGLAIATQMVRIYWKTFLGSTVACNVIMFIARILTCADQMRLGRKTFGIYGLKLRRRIACLGKVIVSRVSKPRQSTSRNKRALSLMPECFILYSPLTWHHFTCPVPNFSWFN